MKDISAAAVLSKIYTNHCERATSITLWSNAGLTYRHIMSISGHRNEQSLQHYNRRPSTSQLKRCSCCCPAKANQANNSMSSHVATTSFTSQSSTVQMQNHPNFAALFSGCSIGNVNINFIQEH